MVEPLPAGTQIFRSGSAVADNAEGFNAPFERRHTAAGTTSLPEEIGGQRNWDYRYCWLRDATFTLFSLMGSGFVDEAKQWRAWLLRAIAGSPERMQILYKLDGGRRLPEFEVPWLSGYETHNRCGLATRPPNRCSSTFMAK